MFLIVCYSDSKWLYKGKDLGELESPPSLLGHCVCFNASLCLVLLLPLFCLSLTLILIRSNRTPLFVILPNHRLHFLSVEVEVTIHVIRLRRSVQHVPRR